LTSPKVVRRGAVAAGTLPAAMFDSGRPATIVIVGTDILLYFMKIDRFEKVSREVMILALNDEGAIEVLGRIDLDVADSESAALTGNSWSGKSTLLHLARSRPHKRVSL
jgi:ABC-type multidrug transport system fused ATPase/permease subunit